MTSNYNTMERKHTFHLWIIWAVFLIAALEISFRFLIFPDWRDVSQAQFENHPVYGTFQKPNLSIRRYNPNNYDVINTTNSMGFRDREEGFEEDLAGIWMVGASNSYGGFVADDKLFSARLQKAGFVNANLASEGHRLYHQVRVVRYLVQQGYRPKAIIVEMTLNNVLGDYTKRIAEISAPLITNRLGQLADPTAQALLWGGLKNLFSVLEMDSIGIKSRLINNSATYCWLKVRINDVPFLRQATLDWGWRADVALSDSVPVKLLRKDLATTDQLVISSTAQFIATVRDWVSKNLDVPFGVVLVPSQHMLNEDRFEKYMAHLNLPIEDYDPALPYRRLYDALRSYDLVVLDTAPAMKRSSKPLNFPDDGHTNAIGHGIIAEEIAIWLERQFGMVPKR